VLEELALPARTAYALQLCIEEMVGNILLHGRREDGGAITIELEILTGPLRLVVRDDAAAFDPTAQPEPAPADDIHSAEIGGRGLPLVRRFSAGMLYERAGALNRVEIRLA
jgi:anti-sigma regulatory factor (Ser/Thr protein kinase)